MKRPQESSAEALELVSSGTGLTFSQVRSVDSPTGIGAIRMATMDDQAKQAFTAASDWSKQILTLSTGIVTLTVTFADKIFGDLTNTEKGLLYTSWLLYLISILGGIWVLTSLTSTLSFDRDLVAADVRQSQNQARLQVIPFIAGTAFIALFGILGVRNQPTPVKSSIQQPAITQQAVERTN